MKKIISFVLVLSVLLSFTPAIMLVNAEEDIGINTFRLQERLMFLNDVDFDMVAAVQAEERQAKIDAMMESYSKDDITFTESECEKIMGQLETGFSIAAAISGCIPGSGQVAEGILQVCSAIAGEGKKSEAEKTQEMLQQMMDRIDTRFDIVDERLENIQEDIQAGVNKLEQNSNYRSLMEMHRDNMMDFDSDVKYIDGSNITHYNGYSSWCQKLQSKYDEIQACYNNEALTQTQKEKKLDSLYKDLFLYANESEDLKFNIEDTTGTYDLDGCSVVKSYYERLFLAKATGILENKSAAEITTYTVNYAENLYNSYAFSMYCRALAYVYRAETIDKYGAEKNEPTGLMSVDEEKIISFFEKEYIEGFNDVEYELTKALVYILALDLEYMYAVDVENPSSYINVPYKSLDTVEIGTDVANNQVKKDATIFLNKIPQYLSAISKSAKTTFEIVSGASLAEVDNNGKVSVTGNSGSFTVAMLYNDKEVYRMDFVITEGAFSGGNGTMEFPYIIATEADLCNICSETGDYSDKSFILVNDLNLSDNELVYNSENDYHNFEPIPEFSGFFDGRGHTISGMEYKMVASNIPGDRDYSFGLIGVNLGTIRNLNIDGFNLFREHSESEKSRCAYSGFLCGANEGDGVIENVNVTNSEMYYWLGWNTSYYTLLCAGGICGVNRGEIKKCSTQKLDIVARTKTDHNTTLTYVGGIAAYLYGSVTDCFATDNGLFGSANCGSHTGGIFGWGSYSGFAYARIGGISGSAESGSNVTRCLVSCNSLDKELGGSYDPANYQFADVKNLVGKECSGSVVENVYEYVPEDDETENSFENFNISNYPVLENNGWTQAEDGSPCFAKAEGQIPSAAQLCRESYSDPYTIELISLPIYEYAISECGGNMSEWQTTARFENLSPATPYKVYTRSIANNLEVASEAAIPMIIMTGKLDAATPVAPTMLSKTATSVTLGSVEGYEYSNDGLIWQASNIFDGLEPNTEYTFYQRIAETDNTYASEKSVGLTLKTMVAVNISGISEETVTVIGDNFNGKVFVALYDNSKRASAVYVYTPVESINVKVGNGVSYTSAKVFWLDGLSTLKPVCEEVEVY